MSEALASVQGMWKVFSKGGEDIEVLQGIDLTISAGDEISIVGQSGSGKSTFLHILGTLERPSRGTLYIDGEDVFSQPNHKIDALRNRHIGFVFQFHHLLPEHDALNNVALPLIISGMSPNAAREEAGRYLEMVGLPHRLTHKPGELSGGEQQRVAIARAMVRQPRLLLADEPTGNLDPKSANGIMELLLSLHEKQGGALVVVTHDRGLANRFPRQLNLVDGLFEESVG